MINATTPTEVLYLPESIDLTAADEIYATFSQTALGKTIAVTKTIGEGAQLVDAHTISVDFTQAETLQFVPRFPVEVQVNWIVGTRRYGTDIGTVSVKKNLIPEVI